MKEGERSPDWRELRRKWQRSESVSPGNFFKALYRRGKHTGTIKREVEAKDGVSKMKVNVSSLCKHVHIFK